jgi:hypothetical protein
MGRGRERVALIKSLIMRDRKDTLEARLQKIELKMSANKSLYCLFALLGSVEVIALYKHVGEINPSLLW